MNESIDIGFLKRMGYEFRELEPGMAECRHEIPEDMQSSDHDKNWRPVIEVIGDYVDFYRASGEEERLG